MELTKEQKDALAAEMKTAVSTEVKDYSKGEIEKISTLIRDKFKALQDGAINKVEFQTFHTKTLARLDEIETKMNRLPVDQGGDKADVIEAAENKALDTWLRKGVVSIEEQKVLKVSDDTAAGYLVSPQITKDLLKTIIEYSNIRGIARIRPTSKTEVWVRKRTGTFAARHVGEVEPKTETTGLTYGMEKIPNHEMYADVIVSNQELEDSDFNLEAQIGLEAGEQFGVLEGSDFVVGTGINMSEGFMVNAEVLAAEILGVTAGAVGIADVLAIFFGLKEPYVKNATWVMRRATLAAIAILQDTANHYVWLPGLNASMPDTILGRPITFSPDMAAVGSLTRPIAFGDFRMGYTIVDRLQNSIIRDPYSQKLNGAVEFTVRKRVGGQVVQSEAIKVMKCLTT